MSNVFIVLKTIAEYYWRKNIPLTYNIVGNILSAMYIIINYYLFKCYMLIYYVYNQRSVL